jgi:D-alanyl-D-alanine carboxypeptidase
MLRPLRLAAGWSIALLAAMLLNLALARPIAAPEAAVLSGGGSTLASSIPTTPLPEIPIDGLPTFVGATPGGEIGGDFGGDFGGDIGGGSARPVELAPLTARQAAALQAATDRARASFGLTALAIGVSLDASKGWTGASGVALDGVTRLNGDSPFAIASITKTFTAALVLQLIGEGRLSLHDRVAELLPHLPIAADVTVAQLLRHTSGIADLLTPLRDRLNAATERIWQPGEVVAEVGQPWFAPGTAWGYSNTNYVLLGMIVERVGGQPFKKQLQERLLSPLGLDSTGELLAHGAPPLMAPSWASAFGASGCMYASPHDLLRWGDALYGGRVLAPRELGHMLDFRSHGYGMGAERIQVGRESGYGHSGLLRGFTSLVVHLPDSGITLVVMGTLNIFDPATVLTHREGQDPSILDLALQAAAAAEKAA